MPEVTDFDLLWTDDPEGIPISGAFGPGRSARYDDLGKALDAARTAPTSTHPIPWIKGDEALFSPGDIRTLNRYRDRQRGRV